MGSISNICGGLLERLDLVVTIIRTTFASALLVTLFTPPNTADRSSHPSDQRVNETYDSSPALRAESRSNPGKAARIWDVDRVGTVPQSVKRLAVERTTRKFAAPPIVLSKLDVGS